MRWIAWGTWIAVCLAGCEIPPEVRVQLTCDVICGCFAGPADQDRCVTECVEEANFATLPEDCFECIQAHANACSTIEVDCEPVCDQPQPPPDPEPDFPNDGGL